MSRLARQSSHFPGTEWMISFMEKKSGPHFQRIPFTANTTLDGLAKRS
jgi:hypothetical protein